MSSGWEVRMMSLKIFWFCWPSFLSCASFSFFNYFKENLLLNYLNVLLLLELKLRLLLHSGLEVGLKDVRLLLQVILFVLPELLHLLNRLVVFVEGALSVLQLVLLALDISGLSERLPVLKKGAWVI